MKNFLRGAKEDKDAVQPYDSSTRMQAMLVDERIELGMDIRVNMVARTSDSVLVFTPLEQEKDSWDRH